MENERKRRCQVSCSAVRTRSSQSGGQKRVRVDAKDNQKALTDCTESRLRTDNFFL